MAKPARDEKGRLLPGNSGNPAGISKVQAEAREAIRNILAEAAPDAARRLVELMDSANERVALTATCEVVNRIGGNLTAEAPTKEAPPRVFRIIGPDGSETVIRPDGEEEDGEFSQPDAG